jgi:RNA polymerase sigma factor (sigma-70 family)
VSQHELFQHLQRYVHALHQFLVRRVGNQGTAADLMQEICVRLAAANHGQPIKHPGAYLFQVAEHVVIDHLRHDLPFRQKYVGAPSETLPAPTPTPEAVASANEQLRVLRQAILDLPPRCRTIFLLHKVEHLSYGDIATRLGISRKTVEKQVSKALAHCRDRLDQATRDP